jgi:hypothetical protein
MSRYPFGNDPRKIEGYRAFWARAATRRPLVGFSIKSWFPLEEFAASRAWKGHRTLTPAMVDPAAFLDDQERLLREGESMEDDILRGASPSQAVQWLAGMLGSTLRILPGSILEEPQRLPWEQVLAMGLDRENPWFRVYMKCARTLVERAAGRFPVSHGTLLGPTDLLADFRGHTEALYDLVDEPARAGEALWTFARIFREVTRAIWDELPLFHGGCYDAQYQLWTPGPIIRMQEDAVAAYSPALYRALVQPVDRFLASSFPSAFIHLHATSLPVLDALLEIEELRCVQMNYEVGSGGPAIREMIAPFRRIQEAGRSLLIRGSFTPEEARLLVGSLDPRGLYIYVMVQSLAETEGLRPIFGM